GTNTGTRAPPWPDSSSLLLLLSAAVFVPDRRARAVLLLTLLEALARCRDAPAFTAPALTLSLTPRLECQTRLRPLPSAISGMERPLTTESGISSSTSASFALRAHSSFDLISSQLSFVSWGRRCMRTRCQLPCSFSPSSVKVRLPFLRPRCGSSSGCQRPRSQIITVPPPYSPCGIVPSNSLYSIG